MTLSIPRSGAFPQVLPMRRQAEVIYELLRERLATVLPRAMRENGIDAWLILCQEDNPDPVFASMIPMDTWTPILQVMVFFDRGGDEIERFNISGTATRDLFQRPYTGQVEAEQWKLLLQLIEERDPKQIGINIGSVQWAAGGLTYNLHKQVLEHLPRKYHKRLVSAEPACTFWLEAFTDKELEVYRSVVALAHAIIADTFSPRAIVPGVTTCEDLRWHYWQLCADRGLEVSFLPFFNIRRGPENRARYGPDDKVIRRGDLVHCDVGIRYLRMDSDHQQWVYIRRQGETEPPEGIRELLRQNNRLQDVFMSEFKLGRTGNQMLKTMLARAKREGIPGPKIYSHSLGHLLHEPGPLIGLPWEQKVCPGRGDVKLVYNSCFTMELSITSTIPEWNDEELRLSTEEDVMFTKDGGCQVIDGRQVEFYLI
ncbi:M24 family metallopeptidase [bacterium]|nr:M24 family metallopeptidase [bacterium]